jgi:hypothetical protein
VVKGGGGFFRSTRSKVSIGEGSLDLVTVTITAGLDIVPGVVSGWDERLKLKLLL